MNIIKVKTVKNYWEIHSMSKKSLITWSNITIKCQWRNVNEIKDTFPSFSVLSNNRAVFNIKGNDFRLITQMRYELGFVYICWVGTHAEYDKIDANTLWSY